MVEEIRAFKRISDRLGTAGQPTAEQLTDIKSAGYEVVINLVPPEQRSLPEEAQIVADLGMDYVNIPVIWTKPTAENLLEFFAAMDAWRDRKRFVHCAANMRVSAFVYLYRVVLEGDDPDEAEQDMLDIWVPDGWWREFIDTMRSSLTAQAREPET